MRTDAQLIERCCAGDHSAWEELILRYQPLIYSVPRRYGLQGDTAGDIFQATCMKLLTELPQLRDVQALPAWLLRVAANLCLQHLREESRLVVDEEQIREDALSTESTQEEVLAQLEREEMIRAAVRDLKPRCQRLIHLLFFEREPRPYAEVARELGLAEGSIGFIRGRCLKQLREKLAGVEFA